MHTRYIWLSMQSHVVYVSFYEYFGAEPCGIHLCWRTPCVGGYRTRSTRCERHRDTASISTYRSSGGSLLVVDLYQLFCIHSDFPSRSRHGMWGPMAILSSLSLSFLDTTGGLLAVLHHAHPLCRVEPWISPVG